MINNAAREQGSYVKGPRDMARHIFEEQRAHAANDNDRGRAEVTRQTAKDHTLAQRGRNMAAMHAHAWEELQQDHKARKAALGRAIAKEIAQARAEIREAFRPEWRAINRDQASEQATFDELERSFFGRLGNMVRTMRLSSTDGENVEGNALSRSFQILTNAGSRREHFEEAQKRAKLALERRQAAQEAQASQDVKDAHVARQAALRRSYAERRDILVIKQEREREELRDAWKARSAERATALREAAVAAERGEALKAEHARVAKPADADDPRSAALARYARQIAFQQAVKDSAKEQDNERSRDIDAADD